MQVKCIRAFGASVPGDLVEVPDGAAVDPAHWEPVTAPETRPAAQFGELLTPAQAAAKEEV